jgi:hypothetical protein
MTTLKENVRVARATILKTNQTENHEVSISCLYLRNRFNLTQNQNFFFKKTKFNPKNNK